MKNQTNSGFLAKALQWLISRQQLLLVLMLALVHLRLMYLIPMPYSRVPILLHFALFLLWQPFINTESRLGAPHLLWIGFGILIAIFGVTWSLLAIWLMLLAGIVGGRVFSFTQGRTKVFYLMALAYLILMLLFQVLPRIIPESIEEGALLSTIAGYGGPVLLVLMVFLPEGREQDVRREAIDLIYSLFVILILAVLVLGSTSLMLLQRTGYIQALLTVLFAAVAMLLTASWLWNPEAGFSRLGIIASRYMLSIGLPFEHWLHSLAELAEKEKDPDSFLDQACHSLVEQMPWVVGCVWAVGVTSPGKEIKRKVGVVETVFRQGELALMLQTLQPLPPVVMWHFNLVTQLVARFYAEKRGGRQLREMVYMQAVHETGARVTHDVKNLLQSLHALLFIVGEDDEGLSAKALPLLRRQLPLITQRLQQTLDKLRAPDDAEHDETMRVEAWWRELRARYEGQGIRFELSGDPGGSLSPALFTSAAENLLQNALGKRAIEPGIEIVVSLDMRGRHPSLSVRDNGSALADDKAKNVCHRPVASENGLGIGLYQLSRLASMAGYALVLAANYPGEVVFSLKADTAA